LIALSLVLSTTLSGVGGFGRPAALAAAADFDSSVCRGGSPDVADAPAPAPPAPPSCTDDGSTADDGRMEVGRKEDGDGSTADDGRMEVGRKEDGEEEDGVEAEDSDDIRPLSSTPKL
jgi:hypothetical protein